MKGKDYFTERLMQDICNDIADGGKRDGKIGDFEDFFRCYECGHSKPAFMAMEEVDREAVGPIEYGVVVYCVKCRNTIGNKEKDWHFMHETDQFGASVITIHKPDPNPLAEFPYIFLMMPGHSLKFLKRVTKRKDITEEDWDDFIKKQTDQPKG